MEAKLVVNSKLINHQTEKAILLEVPIRYYNVRWGIWLPKIFTNIKEEERELEINLPNNFIYELKSMGVDDYNNLIGNKMGMHKWVVPKKDFEGFFTKYNMNLLIFRNEIEKEVKQLIWSCDSLLKGFENLKGQEGNNLTEGLAPHQKRFRNIRGIEINNKTY